MQFKVMIACIFLYGPYIIAGDFIENNLQELVKNQTFVFFDMNVSHDEIDILQNLTINATKVLNNYGDLDLLESQIADFLKELGNDDDQAQVACKIIHTIVMTGLTACKAETGWIALRAFQPTDIYDLRRWHTDGSFYGPHGNRCYKLAYALQGAPTLFIQLPKELRAQFFDLQSQSFGGKTFVEFNKLSNQEQRDLMFASRLKLAELLKDLSVYTPSMHQGVIFVTGDRNKGAIHSEPAIHTNRLFLSIVPGTYEQIQEWRMKNS